jgi:glycosyltransferase involved in cell wall biosynthesis
MRGAPTAVPADASSTRVLAILPAFNEESTLPAVLPTVLAATLVDRVLVVDDGSTDETVQVARDLGAEALRLPENRGKAEALTAAVAASPEPVLLFVDADLAHLTAESLDRLVRPILAGRCGMRVGVRDRGRWINELQGRHGPLLSGVRALRREIFATVPASHLQGYRVETALNWSCRQLGLRVETQVLHGVVHRVKEDKVGLALGLASRMRMFSEVFAEWLRLRYDPPPHPGWGRRTGEAGLGFR